MENVITEKDIETGLEIMKLYHSETDFRRIPMSVEENMLQIVREGRYKDFKVAPLDKLKDNLGHFSMDDKTMYTYIAVSGITLFSRIAIDEGCPADEVFNLSDIFLIKLSSCASIGEIHHLFQLAGEMFAKRIYDRHRHGSPHSYQIEKMLDYISQNIFRKITLQDLADYSGLSTGYISRLFTNELKISLHDYIQKEKINVSCNLLMHTDEPISKIATYMGFQSPSNFTVIFRKWKHTTPTEYRNKMYREVY